MAPLRVAICGGGITGLCLAVELSKYCHVQVSVYEATSQFKEIGAGVMLWSRTWKILEHMGLASQFSDVAHSPPDGKMDIAFDYRRSDQPEDGQRFFLLERPYGCIRFHRAHFLDVFVNNLPSGIAHFGKRLAHYSQQGPDGSVLLEFADGSTSTCDVLVGCDGIKSAIRRQLFTDLADRQSEPELLKYVDPIWTGSTVYRGLIPLDEVPTKPDGTPHRAIKAPTMYCGKSKHIVNYTIAGGGTLNVVACVSDFKKHGLFHPDPWVMECTREEMLGAFADWEPEVRETLQRIAAPTRWAIHHLRPLPFFVSGKVALIGDAAHASTPHQGAGAGQGIEDAYVLANLLGNVTSPSEVSFALQAYEHVRLPLANHVLRGSYESGTMYEFESGYQDDYAKLGPAITRQWNWLDETDPKDELGRALEYMQHLQKN